MSLPAMYLVAGVLMGAGLIGTVTAAPQWMFVALLGVALLMVVYVVEKVRP